MQPSVPDLIYKRLYPHPQQNDPTDFTQYVSKYIIPEVRQETQRFYGNHEDTLESHYPGLDYANKGHRNRLKQFASHRRLFRAFDDLKLSQADIHRLCKWEGTKYSKERYEREHNETVRDTTWDGFKADDRPILAVRSIPAAGYTTSMSQLRGGQYSLSSMRLMEGLEGDQFQAGDETDDEIFENSVGYELQQRLIDATAARARGEHATLDPAWEQWMKDITDRGLIGHQSGNAFAAPGASGSPLRTSCPPFSYSMPPRYQFGSFQPLNHGQVQQRAAPVPTTSYARRQTMTPRMHTFAAVPPPHSAQASMAPPSRLLPSPRHRTIRPSTTRSSASPAR
jgi:hypothetical protein